MAIGMSLDVAYLGVSSPAVSVAVLAACLARNSGDSAELPARARVLAELTGRLTAVRGR